MVSSQHVQTLKTIRKSLRRSEALCAIKGSFSFALQGMDLIVDDIDLQTDACRFGLLSPPDVTYSLKLSPRARNSSHPKHTPYAQPINHPV